MMHLARGAFDTRAIAVWLDSQILFPFGNRRMIGGILSPLLLPQEVLQK